MSSAPREGVASFLVAREYDPEKLRTHLNLSTRTLENWEQGWRKPKELKASTLQKIATFFDVPVTEVQAYFPPARSKPEGPVTAYEAVAANWSRSHGEELQRLLKRAGHTHRSITGHAPVHHRSILHWIRGNGTPNPKKLQQVLVLLGANPEDFQALERVEADGNEFGRRLRDLLEEDLKVTPAVFAAGLGVTENSVISWLNGKSFPRGGQRTILEGALRVTVASVRENQQ